MSAIPLPFVIFGAAVLLVQLAFTARAYITGKHDIAGLAAAGAHIATTIGFVVLT